MEVDPHMLSSMQIQLQRMYHRTLSQWASDFLVCRAHGASRTVRSQGKESFWTTWNKAAPSAAGDGD